MRVVFASSILFQWGHLAAAFNLDVLPKPASWELSASGESYDLHGTFVIAVNRAVASRKTDSSLSLVPPTLQDFAETFAQDLKALYGTAATVELASKPPARGVWLDISPDLTFLANGSPSDEGYAISSSKSIINVTGSSPLGVFWGTRTLLQTGALNGGVFPAGDVIDGPDYAIRGHMLDVGRHWYSAEYLTEICSFLSYFKLNEFHVHLSDNVSPSVPTKWEDYYARFRLYSDSPAFAGLALKNESYDSQMFQKFQDDCASRGVTIIPEIEAPGHALTIVQWRAKQFNETVGRADDETLLNLTIPASTDIVKDIWTEFLPWFQSKEVTIGADEYPSDLADEYITFVNEMNTHIQMTSGKAIRAWGTLEPSTDMSISKNVTIQHWALFDDDPVEVIDQGYPLINSQDWVFYEVIKYSTSYPPPANITRFFDFGIPSTGLTWNTSLFNWTVPSHNPAPGNPLLRGAIAPTWNDNGPAASTDLEHFYETRGLVPATGALAWGAHGLVQAAFEASAPALSVAAPGQNLARSVPSKGKTILEYEFAKSGLQDRSGNGYNARLVGAGAKLTDVGLVLGAGSALETALGSKGIDHTFALTLSLDRTTVLTLSGPDTTLTLKNAEAPTITASNGFTYPLRDLATNASLPLDFTQETTMTFATTEASGTEAWIAGQKVGNFNTPLSHYMNQTYYAWVQMAFVAPAGRITATGGSATLKSWALEDGYFV